MSGYSYTGGPSRCSAYWQLFSRCYSDAEFPKQCAAQRDDYLECIQGTKEKARHLAVQAEYERQQAQGLVDHKKELEAKADGVPTRVGLIPTGDNK
ncbi:hypothetical protein FB45DRAFT_1025858 [Roridomyces roridus]|uniref:NADH dehydrogenase [ubiquinone] iron-sulfur protein 5 n=1 Tax=Roridomyces roridus TaxID=1738132 RepID=A0AAD7FP33_9AGAR|nr:hypothetical protein FB45DRAFT_1025858 [Roridomyces roridus]